MGYMKQFILVAILLTGCASVPNSTSQVESKNEAAVIYGQGGGAGGFLRGALPSLDTFKDTDLSLINGELAVPAKDGENREYWIKPGEYTLWINCFISVDAYKFSNGGEVKVVLEKGKSYLMDTKIGYRRDPILGLPQKTCVPIVVEKEGI